MIHSPDVRIQLTFILCLDFSSYIRNQIASEILQILSPKDYNTIDLILMDD